MKRIILGYFANEKGNKIWGEWIKMYNLKLRDLRNPFKMRNGETIIDIEKYVDILKQNKIIFTDEQYKDAIKEMENNKRKYKEYK